MNHHSWILRCSVFFFVLLAVCLILPVRIFPFDLLRELYVYLILAGFLVFILLLIRKDYLYLLLQTLTVFCLLLKPSLFYLSNNNQTIANNKFRIKLAEVFEANAQEDVVLIHSLNSFELPGFFRYNCGSNLQVYSKLQLQLEIDNFKQKYASACLFSRDNLNLVVFAEAGFKTSEQYYDLRILHRRIAAKLMDRKNIIYAGTLGSKPFTQFLELSRLSLFLNDSRTFPCNLFSIELREGLMFSDSWKLSKCESDNHSLSFELSS